MPWLPHPPAVRPLRRAFAGALVVCLSSGCGRLGFDLLDIEADGGGSEGNGGTAGTDGTGGESASGGTNSSPDAGMGGTDGTGGSSSTDASAGGSGGAAGSGFPDASAGGSGGAAGSGFSDASADGARTDALQPETSTGCSPACVNPHGGTSCIDGACVPVCNAGYDDCDGIADNGCETELDTDPNHCGSCGNACTTQPACDQGMCVSSCSFAGTWAAKLTAQVSWAETDGLAAGSGTLVLWARVEITGTASPYGTSVLPCGLVVPDRQSSSSSELFGSTYPNAPFDRVPSLLDEGTAATTLSISSPGATWDLSAVALLLGADLTDPLNDPWPTDNKAVSSVDVEPDGFPGMTTPYKSDSGYSYPTINHLGGRAEAAYMANRIIFSADGALTDCQHVDATATVTDLDDHVLDCRRVGGSNCTPVEAQFLDSSRRQLVADSATFSMSKVTDEAGCSEVRASGI